jgi:hypothetical protein
MIAIVVKSENDLIVRLSQRNRERSCSWLLGGRVH